MYEKDVPTFLCDPNFPYAGLDFAASGRKSAGWQNWVVADKEFSLPGALCLYIEAAACQGKERNARIGPWKQNEGFCFRISKRRFRPKSGCCTNAASRRRTHITSGNHLATRKMTYRPSSGVSVGTLHQGEADVGRRSR